MPRAASICRHRNCPLAATRDGQCDAHASETEKARGSSTQRGYGSEHQRRRLELLPDAYGKRCPLCGRPMLRAHLLDLHHSAPLFHVEPERRPATPGDQITHRACNLSADKETGRLRPGEPLPVITFRRAR